MNYDRQVFQNFEAVPRSEV